MVSGSSACVGSIGSIGSMMPLPETSSPSTLLPKISRPNRGPGETQRQRFRWGEEEARSEGAFDLGRKRRMRSRFRRGQASRPAIRHAQFRGAAPYPVVDASFISFTPPPAAGFTHYTASPLQTKPAAQPLAALLPYGCGVPLAGAVLGFRLAETKDERRYKL